MELDYEKAIALQGSWGLTPKTPLVDQSSEDTKESQQGLHPVVEETIQNNMQGGLK